MKPLTTFCLAVLTAAILSSLPSSAQDISYGRSKEYYASGLYASAVRSLHLEEDNTAALATLKMYSPKAFKNFTKSFKSPADVHVSQENGETFIFCRVDGIVNRVGYDKKGKWHHTIRYYDAAELDHKMTSSIQAIYKGYEIKGVTEVAVAGELAYFISLEALRSWKVIRIQNDDIDEMESYKK